MKKIIIIIALAFSVLSLSACGSEKMEDFASGVTLDASKYEGKSFLNDGIGEVTLFRNVDGDTAHFVDGTSESFSVRFLGVDTPESTGKIELWGKGASKFTADKLSNAETIVLQSNSSSTESDSNGRYLAWVWVDGRLLNLELVQEGYSMYGSVSGSPYASVMMDADLQAQAFKLRIWSDEEDPDYFYGDAVEVTLKELRDNIEEYNGLKVTFEGIVYKAPGTDGYLQAEFEGKYYGIYVFTQYSSEIAKAFDIGNELQVTGQVAYYEPTVGSGSYQIVDVKYSTIQSLKTEDDIKILSTKNPVVINEVLLPELDIEINPNLERTLVQINGLTAISDGSYTAASSGHITLICVDEDGNKIQVYIRKDYSVNFNSVKLTSHTQIITYCQSNTINIKGIVTQYQGNFQIEITSSGDFIL
ncbi:MAG: thermonuclease family protein [bacterium]